MDIKALNRLLGNIDLYLLDQILKNRFDKNMKILDAGCGEGRNTHYFIQEGYQIFGTDINPTAIQMARLYAKTLDPAYDLLRFQVAPIEALPFHDGAFDVLLSSAVMHFALNTAHFFTMLSEQMRVLKKGGIFWLRMCTDAGGCISLGESLGQGRYRLPDGTDRFVINEELTQTMVRQYKFEALEPPKSVLVHGQRAMGAFVFCKGL
jgi:ubiquinone/menaquinone biosynthesis C-methylase UbiE